MKDVALFAVFIVNQRNASITVGVVLNGGNFRGDIVFVTLKVNLTIQALVSTATVTTGNNTTIISPLWTVHRVSKRLFRLISRDGREV